MKKKVLFMIDSLTCGGAEKSLISLLPLLDFSKYDVDLMMVNRGGIFEQFLDSRVNVIPFPGQNCFFALIARVVFSLLLRIKKCIHGAELRWSSISWSYKSLKKKYDVAIAYQQGFPTYYIAEKVNANKKIAWVNADITKVGYRADFNRFFYDKMDAVCPVSDKLFDILQKSKFVNSKKLFVIYDILNVDLIHQMSLQFVENVDCGTLKICTVGRMVPLKNYPLAVETAKVLKGKNLNFCWFFVGDGSDRQVVESLINQYDLNVSIKLVGMTPNPYPYMAAADIFVQTSRFEGFGLTIAEAKILKKPVVSTNFDVVHDQLEHGKNGLIAEMTPESLADNILNLVNDTSLRKEIVSNLGLESNKTYITEIKKVESLLDEN